MDINIERALKGINERDVDKLATAVALKIHGLPASYSDTELVFPDTTIRHGRIFVDSWSGNIILLTWALPTRAGNKWKKASTIELTVGRGSEGGYSAAVIVKTWASGQRHNARGPYEAATIAEAVDSVFRDLFMDPHQFVLPYTQEIPSDEGFRALKKRALIFTNLAILGWLVLPFMRFINGAPDAGFKAYDPLILLAILAIGIGSVLVSRRAYLDKVHIYAAQGLKKGLAGKPDRGIDSESSRVPIEPQELEDLENEKFDMGWWLCMFAAIIAIWLVLDAFILLK